MLVAMAQRHPRHPDQARRPHRQHADARAHAAREAGAHRARDARDLRAARQPAGHPAGSRSSSRTWRSATYEPERLRRHCVAQLAETPARARRLHRRGLRDAARSSARRARARGAGHGTRQAPLSASTRRCRRPAVDVEQIHDVIAFRVDHRVGARLLRGAGRRALSSGRRCRGASRTSSRSPSPTCTSRCTRPVIGPRAERMEVQIRTAGDAPHRRAGHRGALEVQGGQTEVARPRTARGLRLAAPAHGVAAAISKDPTEFIETVKVDLFQDEVFVFTPKGDVKSLPGCATPVDFAYCHPLDIGEPLRGGQGQRQDRSPPLQAEERGHRGGAHQPQRPPRPRTG